MKRWRGRAAGLALRADPRAMEKEWDTGTEAENRKDKPIPDSGFSCGCARGRVQDKQGIASRDLSPAVGLADSC